MKNLTTPRFGLGVLAVLTAVTAVTACTVADDTGASRISGVREENSPAAQVREPVMLATDGSLAALTAEVRELRLTMLELTRSHAETQALSGYLAAQEDRVGNVAERLDAARREVDLAAESGQQIEIEIAMISEDLSRATDASQRSALEQHLAGARAEQERRRLVLQQARDRESELSRALQLEEAQWNELVSRAENLTR